MSSKPTSCKDLLKSEYISVPEHVMHTLDQKGKEAPKTFRTSSSLIGRIQKFLPQMEEAQKDLQNKSQEDLNVENIAECDQVIEMNLSLFEHQSSSDLGSSCEDNSDDSSDTEEDRPEIILPVTSRKTKLKNAQPAVSEFSVKETKDM